MSVRSCPICGRACKYPNGYNRHVHACKKREQHITDVVYKQTEDHINDKIDIAIVKDMIKRKLNGR